MQASKQANKQKGMKASKQAERHRSKQANKQAERHGSKQTPLLVPVEEEGAEDGTAPLRSALFLVFMSSVTFFRPEVTPPPCKGFHARVTRQFCCDCLLHIWDLKQKIGHC